MWGWEASDWDRLDQEQHMTATRTTPTEIKLRETSAIIIHTHVLLFRGDLVRRAELYVRRDR